MATWLSRIRAKLRARLWVIPAAASVAAIAVAKGLVMVDGHIGQQRQAWFLFGGQAENARELLSTIASSMMTFTALAFSITILGLQLASAQFSPRVLGTFLEDRKTQVAIASFVGTFVFSMTLLPEVRTATAAQSDFVPALSIFCAFLLVLTSVGVFIHYIDHMAHSVRAIAIIKRVAAETRESLLRTLPENAVSSGERTPALPDENAASVVAHDGLPGVLAEVDEKALLEAAQRFSAVIAVVPMPGDFVPRGAPLLRVWSAAGADSDLLRRAVVIEKERTAHQDPSFGFRQLVDIADRALSPGVNDPTTAVQVLDELHDLLRALGSRPFASPLRLDAAGVLRLILPRPGWDAYVRLALDEIRQYGGRSVQVLRRMRALILDCITTVPDDRRASLEEQLRLLDEATDREVPPAERSHAHRPNAQGQGGAG
ncbi:MAG TPA: DUF2254 domain-containing protein [Polyangiaceae bacterium]